MILEPSFSVLNQKWRLCKLVAPAVFLEREERECTEEVRGRTKSVDIDVGAVEKFRTSMDKGAVTTARSDSDGVYRRRDVGEEISSGELLLAAPVGGRDGPWGWQERASGVARRCLVPPLLAGRKDGLAARMADPPR